MKTERLSGPRGHRPWGLYRAQPQRWENRVERTTASRKTSPGLFAQITLFFGIRSVPGTHFRPSSLEQAHRKPSHFWCLKLCLPAQRFRCWRAGALGIPHTGNEPPAPARRQSAHPAAEVPVLPSSGSELWGRDAALHCIQTWPQGRRCPGCWDIPPVGNLISEPRAAL